MVRKQYIPKRFRENRDVDIPECTDRRTYYEGYFPEPDFGKYVKEYFDKRDEIEAEFEKRTKLTKVDIAFMVFAAAIQTLRWSILSNDTLRFDEAKDADKAFSRLGKASGNKSIKHILSDHTVPYDATRLSDDFIGSVGLAGKNHRYMTLGHDPVIGLLVGTANIATGTLTVNKFDFINPYPTYFVENQVIVGETTFASMMSDTATCVVDKPEVIAVSLGKQILHMGTDIFTKQGLPIPGINLVSSELPKFLCSDCARIDLYSTVRSVMLAMVINRIIGMIHKFFYNPNTDGSIDLYDVRTRKILTYSNLLSSCLSIGYVGITGDFTRLDVGGIAVTLWRILTDSAKVAEIKAEFMGKYLDKYYLDKEDKVNTQLAKFGYEF